VPSRSQHITLARPLPTAGTVLDHAAGTLTERPSVT
jgi:hypothetical protein